MNPGKKIFRLLWWQPNLRYYCAIVSYVLSVLTLISSTVLASSLYPNGYDWVYTVMSALASRKHNPDGGAYFAFGLALSLVFLWLPVLEVNRRTSRYDRLGSVGAWVSRVGIFLGVLVGIERLLFIDVSQNAHKGHEILALICFLNLYLGSLLVQVGRIRHCSGSFWPAWVIIVPLVGIGASQLVLYLDQRDLGWVDTSWRAMGIPFWMSFAFWQWFAVATLWLCMGQLIASARTASWLRRG